MANRWAARVALVLSVAMVAGVLAVWGATGHVTGTPLLAMGVDVDSSTGSRATYELVVTNRGTAPAQDVVVSAVVPKNTTFWASSPAPSSGCNNGAAPEGPGVECSWDAGTRNAGEASSIWVVLKLDRSDAYTVKYAAKADGSNADANSDADRSLQREATNNRARAFRVSVQQEPATCIDADPDSNVTFTGDEFRIDALVTEGEKIGDDDDDSCDGSPVANEGVIFEIEVDEPDVYFSSEEGQATTKTREGDDAQPNTVTTETDSDGETFVGVRLDEPNSDNENENRIGARIEGTDDPDAEPACDPIETPLCMSESDTEDDVMTEWSTTSPTPSPTRSPTGSPSPSPSPETQCSDGEDNDGDGRVDTDDRGCDSAQDNSEAGPFRSKVTIRERFKGKVSSPRRRCVRNRQVVVKKVRRGKDRTIARDRTNRRGNWAERRANARGRFYAKVLRSSFVTETGDRIKCRPDRSPTVRRS